MAGSVIGAVAGGIASAGAAKLFGGGSQPRPTQANLIPSFKFGGLTGTGGTSSLTITPGTERATAVSRSANILNRQADELAAVRAKFAPGFGELTSARLAEIESARQRSIGNLQENLARRRIAGSSFASDAIARAEREFAQASATERAQSILQELDVTTQLINQEFQTRQQAVERTIAELDFQTEVGARLLSGVSGELGAAARLEAQLAAEAAAGRGAFFEPVVSSIGNVISEALGGGKIFGTGAEA